MSSLCNLCVLRVSVVKTHHGGTENTEVAQRIKRDPSNFSEFSENLEDPWSLIEGSRLLADREFSGLLACLAP